VPLITLIDGQPYYYELDHRMMPVRLWDQNGQIAWQGNADAWGNCQPETFNNAIHQPLRLPGQFEDELTGIVQNRFRDYDPATGRYLTPDPYGIKGGLSSYRYTPNPVDYVDPLGLDFESVVTTKNAQKGPEAVLDDVPAPPASELPEPDSEWIGLKKNEDEDLILCVGEEACADPSNVADAGWGDVAAWGAMLLVERVPVGRVLDKVPVPKGVKDKLGKDAGIEQVAQKKKMAPPPPAKKWTEKEVEGRKVYQRDDFFDPNRVDDFGKTNIERMKKVRHL